jgi:hypothetical protein
MYAQMCVTFPNKLSNSSQKCMSPFRGMEIYLYEMEKAPSWSIYDFADLLILLIAK